LSQRLVLVFLGGVSLVAIGLVIQARSQSEARERATKAELASLRGQMASLRGDQQQVRLVDVVTRLAAAQAAASSEQRGASDNAATPAHEASGDSGPMPTREELVRRSSEQIQQRAQQLDRVLAADGVDRGWSAQTVDSMYRVFSGVTGGRLRNAQCGSRLCRVEVEHTSRDEQRALAEQLLHQDPFTHGVLFNYDKLSTPLKTTMYVAREGQALAKLGLASNE
jgi:hypothetical protein